jgi:predicted nucleic acid-binding protein
MIEQAPISGDEYMLDTNVFNDVADGNIPLDAFAGRRVFATHVQIDELSASKSEQADALLKEFERIRPSHISTASATCDVSKWDQASWTDDPLCQKITARLRELDAETGKTHRDPNNTARDALIADTAIKSQLILVSGDRNLRRIVEEFGGRAINVDSLGGWTEQMTSDQ